MDQLLKFGAYVKARRLFDLVADDMETLLTNPLCTRMIDQQMASADSVCSNIEEGYGRESSKEYRHFLIIARGSARETQGRYMRLGRWLTAQRIESKVALCDEIIGILSATIVRLSEK